MSFILKGEVDMLKKAIVSGALFVSILLAGCNGESEVIVLEDSGSEEVLPPETIFMSELQNEIKVAIPEQMGLNSEPSSIFISGNLKDLSVSVGFPKKVKVDDTIIQQIVQDCIKKVSVAENVTISEEAITIKIQKN